MNLQVLIFCLLIRGSSGPSSLAFPKDRPAAEDDIVYPNYSIDEDDAYHAFQFNQGCGVPLSDTRRTELIGAFKSFFLTGKTESAD
jgi:hypothetical protein